MRIIVAGQRVVTRAEFAELAFGVDYDLFAGVSGETREERRARLDVAGDVLEELDREAPELAAYAVRLLKGVPLARSIVSARAA